MPDADLKVTFNDANESKLVFVQGEDRTVPLTILDQRTGKAVDLTGCTLQVALPRIGGGAVRRVAGAVAVSTSARVGPVFAHASHGLVTGDVVRVAAIGSGVLPTGLLAATDYVVRVVDVDTFAFQQAGADVVITASGSGLFGVTNSTDLVIDQPTFGHAVLSLSAIVTASVMDRVAQDMQVNIVTNSTGKVRIAVLTSVLDVLAQPVV